MEEKGGEGGAQLSVQFGHEMVSGGDFDGIKLLKELYVAECVMDGVVESVLCFEGDAVLMVYV